MTRHTITAVAAIAVAATTVAAFAHGGATGVVKERMDAMGAMQKATKALTEMMRGQTQYDAAAVREHAVTIRSHAGEAMTDLFPEGSNGMPSEARDEVWSDWDQFSALADRLERLSKGLEKAAGNQPGGDAGSASGTASMMGSHSMMGTSMMGGDADMPNDEMLAQMPADAVFGMVAQTCSACHTQFRIEK